MLALKGIYENGIVTLEKPLKTDKKMEVIVTFLEEENDRDKILSLKDFSFMETRQKTSKYNFSLSNAVLEERKEGL